jgi:hypothetical protein
MHRVPRPRYGLAPPCGGAGSAAAGPRYPRATEEYTDLYIFAILYYARPHAAQRTVMKRVNTAEYRA